MDLNIRKQQFFVLKIDEKTREEIKIIREIVRAKELKLQQRKEEKDRENTAKQLARDENDANKSRRLSYTMTSPVFDSELLPKISVDSSDSDKDTVIDGTFSLQSVDLEQDIDVDENAADKSSKDLRNELDKRSATPASSIYESVIVPQVNNQLKQLIEKQKHEYLKAMEAMKNKFSSEQQELLVQIQNNLQVTSTPLNVSMVPSTDDEDFSAFKTCLQSQSISLEEKTIVNDHDAKVSWRISLDEQIKDFINFQLRASTIINAYVRGFLTRKLMKTIYVQEHIRNVKETLQLVLNLADQHIEGNPVQNILLKAKLFRQLQSDLNLFNEIFFNYPTNEQMKIISADREIRSRKLADDDKENFAPSFNDLMLESL